MKYCLYGNDISQDTNPLEAGLGWITKLEKGEFIGSRAVQKVKDEGVTRRLVAMELLEKAFPRPHYPIVKNGMKAGEVTSGTVSPSLEKGICLGYVGKDYAKVGTELAIQIRGKDVPAVVVKPPFYKDSSLAKP
jgi:aminomethyltransferase